MRYIAIMRNHLEILEEIDKLLLEHGFYDERQKLENEVEASFSGSELCLRSASKLLTLQKMNKEISSVVGAQISELITYCHHNGLYPKINYGI